MRSWSLIVMSSQSTRVEFGRFHEVSALHFPSLRPLHLCFAGLPLPVTFTPTSALFSIPETAGLAFLVLFVGGRFRLLRPLREPATIRASYTATTSTPLATKRAKQACSIRVSVSCFLSWQARHVSPSACSEPATDD